MLLFWLKRKKAALCILAGICSLSLFIIFNSDEKIKENTGGSYVIKIRHYGIDAAEMERSVTIPLEDVLFAIPGVITVQSSSENSLSSVFIRFRQGGKGNYEAVRDAAQRVYEALPSSAQRPEILSSNNSRIPVWSAAVTGNISPDIKENVLTKTLKPRLESLEGTGEVIVSGTGLKEIFIILDQEKIALLGLDPAAVSAFLGMNDSVFPGGSVIQHNREIIITVDGRYNQEKSTEKMLEKALIPLGDGKFIELSDIAVITEQERTPDILSRLNGRKTAGIAIMGQNDTDLRKLSSGIKREISGLDLPLEFTVLADLGAQEEAAFRSVLNAAISGAVMVAVISLLLTNGARSRPCLHGHDRANRKESTMFHLQAPVCSLFCALAIPLICLISAAILLLAGFSADRLLLAGIAVGVGTAVDAVILCAEKLRRCIDYKSASQSLRELAGPLVAGAATTIVALIPLSAVEDGSVRIIAGAIAAVTVVSLVISLSLLPPLLLWETNISIKRFKTINFKLSGCLKSILSGKRKLFRLLCRFLAVNLKFCFRYPIVILSVSLAFTIIAVLVLFGRGTDTADYGSDDSVYAQVEFEGGLLAEEADRLLAAYSEQLLTYAGIKNVETGARTGSGSLLISFDPKQTKAHLVRDFSKQIPIPGGFVFFHENSAKDRYWEIKIYGDENQKCRELAEELAFICADHPLIRERVLNFKEGSKKLTLLPDREMFAKAGYFFSGAASRIRMGVYGPVAYKRMDLDGETDVRIITGDRDFLNYGTNSVMRQSKEGTLNIPISAAISAGSLMHLSDASLSGTETEPSGIIRDNRRRTASITITTAPMDPRRVKKELSSVFNKLDLPSGYYVEFDPEAIRQAEMLSATVFSLVIAVIFCYMILASINESFTVPLIVLSAIPPSLSFPAICLVLSGSAYNTAVACSFIAVSGMTVNAAVLCAGELRTKIQNGNKASIFSLYLSIRKKIPALLSTTGTTIIGAIPFLFLKEGANLLIRTLSLISVMGVAGSCICSITVIPSLFIFSKKVSCLCGEKQN